MPPAFGRGRNCATGHRRTHGLNDDATSVLTRSGECGYRVTWGVSP
ncbi:hypothetical protein ABT215_24320 [Streptomyces sp900105755]